MRPETEEELADLVQGARGPLAIAGGGTRGIELAGDPVSVAGLSGVTLYEPGALTMVARAGTPVAEVAAALAAEGQHLPWEPADPRVVSGAGGAPTIGAVFACNASGPRRVAVGAARDFLLGVRFVDGRGSIVRNGGRVMKNVTGLDLVKLMAGAHGTLGVLTEVSFKVLPRPASVVTLALQGLDPGRAVAAMAAALGSPFGVTGAAHLPEAGETWLRIEGTAASTGYRAGRLAGMLARFGAAEEIAADWSTVRDAAPLAGAGDLWRISVKPSDAPGIVARLPGGARWFFDWGGGLVWVAVPPGCDLRAAIAPFAGHATRVTGIVPGSGGARFQPETPAVAALTAGLRAKFDPRNILNPGLFG